MQPGDGGVDVFGVVPAEQVRVALAAVIAARVEQEHAVAVAGEHPRLRQLARARRVGDHGRAVARADIPAGEPEAVARPQRHLLVGSAQADLLDRSAGAVRGQNRHRDRNDEPVSQDNRDEPKRASAQPAEPPRLARAPEPDGRENNENKPDREEQEAGPVFAAGTDRAGIGDREHGALERERPEHRRDRRPSPGGKTWIEIGGPAEDRERHPASQKVVARAGPGLGSDEGVDGGVQRKDRYRAREEKQLNARPREVQGGRKLSPPPALGLLDRGLMHSGSPRPA